MATSSVPLGKARTDLSELCSRAARSGTRIVLTRHGRPAAALVSIEDLAALETPQAPRIIESIELPAQLGPTWMAFVSSRRRSAWWGELSIDAFEGGEAALWGMGMFGRIATLVEGELIRIEWSDGRGEVAIRFAYANDVTVVSVEHSMDRGVWPERLDALRSYLSTQS